MGRPACPGLQQLSELYLACHTQLPGQPQALRADAAAVQSMLTIWHDSLAADSKGESRRLGPIGACGILPWPR